MSNLLAKWFYKMTLQIHSTTLTDTRKKYEKFKNQKIQGRTVDEWDVQWINVGSLHELIYHTTHLNNYIGLYRLKLNNEILFIGHSIDYYRGGLRKQLLELIYNNQYLYTMLPIDTITDSSITVDVLIVGNSVRSVDSTKQLKLLFVGKYLPRYN